MLPVQVSQRHRILGVPFRDDVRNLFPSAKQVRISGNEILVVPHGPMETYLLRKLGYEVPAPINTHYDYRGGNPFDVQRKTCALLTMNPRAYVLNGMGTGKTKAALWAWDYLRSTRNAKKMLVVAPLSTLRFTWGREIFQTLPGVKYVVLHGTREKRLALLNDPDAEIFIINHDGLKVVLDEVAAHPEIDTLVLDELAVYRNGGAQRTKLTRKLAQGNAAIGQCLRIVRLERKRAIVGRKCVLKPSELLEHHGAVAVGLGVVRKQAQHAVIAVERVGVALELLQNDRKIGRAHV